MMASLTTLAASNWADSWRCPAVTSATKGKLRVPGVACPFGGGQQWFDQGELLPPPAIIPPTTSPLTSTQPLHTDVPQTG